MSQYQLMSLLGNVHALEHKRLENELSVRIWWMAILFLSGYSKYLQLLIRCITWCDKRNTFFMREIGCSAVCVYRYWSSGFGGQLNCFARRNFVLFIRSCEISSRITSFRFQRWHCQDGCLRNAKVPLFSMCLFVNLKENYQFEIFYPITCHNSLTLTLTK